MSETRQFGKFRTILMFGAPGSGKGTQGKVLGTIPRFHHMACGDVFRRRLLRFRRDRGVWTMACPIGSDA